MSETATTEPSSKRLPISAEGAVDAIKLGSIGTGLGGAIAVAGIAMELPVAIVAAAPVLIAAACALGGYYYGARNKSE